MRISRRSDEHFTLALALTAGALCTALISCGGSDDDNPANARSNSAIEDFVISDPVTVADTSPTAQGKSLVTVQMLTQGKLATVTTESVATADVLKLTANPFKGALVASP